MPFGQAALKFCLPRGCVPLGWSGLGSVIQVLCGSWCIKGTDESTTIVDSSVPLIHWYTMIHTDPHRWLILIQITPNEPTLNPLQVCIFQLCLQMTCMISCPLVKWEWKFYLPGRWSRATGKHFVQALIFIHYTKWRDNLTSKYWESKLLGNIYKSTFFSL